MFMRIWRIACFSGFFAIVSSAGCASSGAHPANPGANLDAAKDKLIKLDAKHAPFVAEKKARIYHKRHCKYAADMNSSLGFANEWEAQRSGRMPCRFCCPHDYPETPPISESGSEKQ